MQEKNKKWFPGFWLHGNVTNWEYKRKSTANRDKNVKWCMSYILGELGKGINENIGLVSDKLR